jgi:phosphoribosylglycinamide formyltransferase-1
MTTSQSAKLVVLVSGHGSNLQAILDACRQGRLNAHVQAVFSNKADAYGLERSRQAGVMAVAFPKPHELDRRVYDAMLSEQVAAYQPDWVVLAGWMRLLTSAFLECFPGKVVNLHPALPGMFPGTNAIERAFEAFQQGLIPHTGVMVHLVPDEGVDSGPVLGQEIVPMYAGEGLAALEERIHVVEHELLVRVLQSLTDQDGTNRI